MLTLTPHREISLRPYQADAVDALRDGIRAGRKRQILVAPTGAGKTIVATHLLKQASDKGSYAVFLVDRVALVNQTSQTLDDYGIRHGIVQGNSERWSPHENVQVCSIQSLARRFLPRRPSLIIYDEAHAQYKSSIKFIEDHPEAVAIGLTATPFTPGMGKFWNDAVNVTTTRALVDDGFLIQPKIYVAKSPDDKELGLNSFGEFSDESAGAAGIRIVGDVVSEWIGKTHEHFGGPAKSIVFSPTVEHGREICAAFAAAGYNFQQISYLDRSDDERAAKIGEFRRHDSMIHGLVSCGVLTKGFDVPDVLIGVSCKPYRKSLSSHMQEIGRVMRSHPDKTRALWLCLARDSRVLTDRGIVPIQFITRQDKVWDGESFVPHGGAICRGIQDVITYRGLTATPGHLVHTVDGWRTFGECARKQIAITQTGFGRVAIRLGGDHLSRRYLARGQEAALHSRYLRMRDLWISVSRVIQQFAIWTHERMQSLQSACTGLPYVALQSSAGAEASLRKSEKFSIRCIWRAWHRISVPGREGRYDLDHGKPWHSRGLQAPRLGPNKPGRPLRAGERPLASPEVEFAEQKRQSSKRQGSSVQDRSPGSEICRFHLEATPLDGHAIFGDRGEVLPKVAQTKREVWDILDAGPHNRFTCEGLLVHNCHSGNIERFALDMFDVWDNGAGLLSTAEKRDSETRKRDEQTREKVVCPECSGALRGNTCTACGWERPARSGIHAAAGSLHEFNPEALGLTTRPGLRAECLKDPRKVWHAALHYCFAHSRDGDKARKWAYGVFRGIFPGAKLPFGWYDAAPGDLDQGAYDLIGREIKRFRKNNKRVAA